MIHTIWDAGAAAVARAVRAGRAWRPRLVLAVAILAADHVLAHKLLADIVTETCRAGKQREGGGGGGSTRRPARACTSTVQPPGLHHFPVQVGGQGCSPWPPLSHVPSSLQTPVRPGPQGWPGVTSNRQEPSLQRPLVWHSPGMHCLSLHLSVGGRRVQRGMRVCQRNLGNHDRHWLSEGGWKQHLQQPCMGPEVYRLQWHWACARQRLQQLAWVLLLPRGGCSPSGVQVPLPSHVPPGQVVPCDDGV